MAAHDQFLDFTTRFHLANAGINNDVELINCVRGGQYLPDLIPDTEAQLRLRCHLIAMGSVSADELEFPDPHDILSANARQFLRDQGVRCLGDLSILYASGLIPSIVWGQYPAFVAVIEQYAADRKLM